MTEARIATLEVPVASRERAGRKHPLGKYLGDARRRRVMPVHRRFGLFRPLATSREPASDVGAVPGKPWPSPLLLPRHEPTLRLAPSSPGCLNRRSLRRRRVTYAPNGMCFLVARRGGWRHSALGHHRSALIAEAICLGFSRRAGAAAPAGIAGFLSQEVKDSRLLVGTYLT